jgi:hypothetical protein
MERVGECGGPCEGKLSFADFLDAFKVANTSTVQTL